MIAVRGAQFRPFAGRWDQNSFDIVEQLWRRTVRKAAGISSALVLGFGRALGETMALAMLIGNSNQISLSLFSPAPDGG
jgi:hypothetical protein